jgi:hypothetical protein
VVAGACNPVHRRLRQKDQKFEVSVGYIARPCLKKPKSQVTKQYIFIYLFIYLAVLRFKLRALTLSHSTSPFPEGFFKIGSLELFARAGFKLQSSRSLPLEYLGLQA